MVLKDLEIQFQTYKLNQKVLGEKTEKIVGDIKTEYAAKESALKIQLIQVQNQLFLLRQEVERKSALRTSHGSADLSAKDFLSQRQTLYDVAPKRTTYYDEGCPDKMLENLLDNEMDVHLNEYEPR